MRTLRSILSICLTLILLSSTSSAQAITPLRDTIQAQISQRCDHLRGTYEWRLCVRGQRSRGVQHGLRTYEKRITRGAVIRNIETCRAKETVEEKLHCLRGDSQVRRRTVRAPTRPRLSEKEPIQYLNLRGIRRYNARVRNIVREKCGEILDGAEKRACYQTTRAQLR